jgi:nitroreductase
VVKDMAVKQSVQKLYKRAYDEVIGPRYAGSAPPPGSDPARYARQHAAVEYLTEHFHEAPVWIVVCQEDGTAAPSRSSGASVYPAVQNMLLAARALGLGSTLTTRHMMFAAEADAAFGLPEGVHSYAILPLGYPMGKFGPVGRGKLEDVVFADRWGMPYGG